MRIKADLHIHSCLSPCGSLEMSPSVIAAKAAERGLDAAALTDHNCALNSRAFEICCRRNGILPVFGLEVTSLEEAHVLCLFGTAGRAEELGRQVYDSLPDIPNNPEKTGDQVYVDENENIIGEAEKYLLSASGFSLGQLYNMVMKLDGLFIPAHIDRPMFSIPSQLGFLPEMGYSALETTVLPCPVETGTTPLIRNSDAHYPEDIGKRFTQYETESISFDGISSAISSCCIVNS